MSEEKPKLTPEPVNAILNDPMPELDEEIRRRTTEVLRELCTVPPVRLLTTLNASLARSRGESLPWLQMLAEGQ